MAGSALFRSNIRDSRHTPPWRSNSIVLPNNPSCNHRRHHRRLVAAVVGIASVEVAGSIPDRLVEDRKPGAQLLASERIAVRGGMV